MDTTFYILSTNLPFLRALAARVDQREGYPVPGGQTLRHALVETRRDGAEYALLVDAVGAKHNERLLAADWQALRTETRQSVEYVIPDGRFAGETMRITRKGAEWTSTAEVAGE